MTSNASIIPNAWELDDDALAQLELEYQKAQKNKVNKDVVDVIKPGRPKHTTSSPARTPPQLSPATLPRFPRAHDIYTPPSSSKQKSSTRTSFVSNVLKGSGQPYKKGRSDPLPTVQLPSRDKHSTTYQSEDYISTDLPRYRSIDNDLLLSFGRASTEKSVQMMKRHGQELSKLAIQYSQQAQEPYLNSHAAYGRSQRIQHSSRASGHATSPKHLDITSYVNRSTSSINSTSDNRLLRQILSKLTVVARMLTEERQNTQKETESDKSKHVKASRVRKSIPERTSESSSKHTMSPITSEIKSSSTSAKQRAMLHTTDDQSMTASTVLAAESNAQARIIDVPGYTHKSLNKDVMSSQSNRSSKQMSYAKSANKQPLNGQQHDFDDTSLISPITGGIPHGSLVERKFTKTSSGPGPSSNTVSAKINPSSVSSARMRHTGVGFSFSQTGKAETATPSTRRSRPTAFSATGHNRTKKSRSVNRNNVSQPSPLKMWWNTESPKQKTANDISLPTPGSLPVFVRKRDGSRIRCGAYASDLQDKNSNDNTSIHT